jgi:hypothetical protein
MPLPSEDQRLRRSGRRRKGLSIVSRRRHDVVDPAGAGV